MNEQKITPAKTKPHFLTPIAAGLCAFLCGCGTAKVSRQHAISPAPVGKPKTIYVSDFELDAAEIKSDQALIPAPPKLPGPIGDVLPSLPGTHKDPKQRARQLIDELSDALVKDLAKAGLTARRLPRGASAPPSGWLVRGVFTEVNEGNQLSRSVVGFGLGKTDVQVLVALDDLERGAPRNFYELSTTADSGKAPGAGPTIVFGPAGLATRFVIAGHDLDRNVKQTASKIAQEVVQRAEQSPTAWQASL